MENSRKGEINLCKNLKNNMRALPTTMEQNKNYKAVQDFQESFKKVTWHKSKKVKNNQGTSEKSYICLKKNLCQSYIKTSRKQYPQIQYPENITKHRTK